MKVIDLLNKIANGEEPPEKIKLKTDVYEKEFYWDGDIYKYKDYDGEYAMTDDVSIEMALNDEVEIIEKDKKIPTLKNLNLTKIDINKEGQVYVVTKKEMIADIQTLQNWINKIIDSINKEK